MILMELILEKKIQKLYFEDFEGFFKFKQNEFQKYICRYGKEIIAIAN